jgi:hypothetical protein
MTKTEKKSKGLVSVIRKLVDWNLFGIWYLDIGI